MSAIVKVKAKTTTRGTDKMVRIKKSIAEAKGSYVSVGWEGTEAYPDGGPLVGQVALWNELGTYDANHKPRSPARPFMRPAIDENKAVIDKVREEAIQQACFGEWTCARALASIGQTVVDLIKEKIRSNVPPELAASTAAKKVAQGRAPVTLVDTGRMLNTLSFKVHLTDKLKMRDEAKLKEQTERAAKTEKRKAARAALRAEGAKQREDAKVKRKATKEQRAIVMAKLREAAKARKARTKAVKKAVTKTVKGAKKSVRRTAKNAKKGVQRTAKKAAKGIGRAAKAIGRIAAGKAPRKPRPKKGPTP